MKVICAGFSKTGTKSLAKALRILGFTVYDHLEHRKFHNKQWVDLYGEGQLPDFRAMYEGVDAVIGLPASDFGMRKFTLLSLTRKLFCR